MIKHESNSSLLLRHYLRAHPLEHSCTFEMKDSRSNDYLNFSEVKQSQLDYALAIESDKGVLIRTQAIYEGMPDYTYHHKQPAYIVIKYPNCFCAIRVKDFIKEKENSKRKSLTSERAIAIAEFLIQKTA